jgi:hypothetical protein
MVTKTDLQKMKDESVIKLQNTAVTSVIETETKIQSILDYLLEKT